MIDTIEHLGILIDLTLMAIVLACWRLGSARSF
jgi:hypothetical protein